MRICEILFFEIRTWLVKNGAEGYQNRLLLPEANLGTQLPERFSVLVGNGRFSESDSLEQYSQEIEKARNKEEEYSDESREYGEVVLEHELWGQ